MSIIHLIITGHKPSFSARRRSYAARAAPTAVSAAPVKPRPADGLLSPVRGVALRVDVLLLLPLVLLPALPELPLLPTPLLEPPPLSEPPPSPVDAPPVDAGMKYMPPATLGLTVSVSIWRWSVS